jgi:alkylation response protein AidB-like acyl-CoA dehydrogenase
MRLALTADQQALARTVRELLAAECTPDDVRAAWADGGRRSSARWARLAELGVPGLTVPEKYGGLGAGEVELAAVLAETGWAALPEAVVENAVGVGLLGEAGGELAEEWLPRVAAGQVRVGVGLDRVPYVADADLAGLFLLPHGDELHAVRPEAVTCTRQPSVDGARRLFAVTWAPRAATLAVTGPPARAALAAAFNRGALGTAAQLLGITARLIEMAVEYARARRQFGRPVGAYQAVQHQLADALLHSELARPVVYRAAWSMAHGEPAAPRDVSMAKCYAAEAATFTARVALQVHGAVGYTDECDLHLWLKRALVLPAAWGDAGWHRRRVAEALLGA